MSPWALPLLSLGPVLLIAHCASPTQLTVSVSSEVPCKSDAKVMLVGASSLAGLASSAPSATSTRCVEERGASRMGEVVLVPAGAKDEAIAFAIATRPDGQPADDCLEPGHQAGCIVARRQLRFVPRESTSISVALRLSCLGVACPDDQTCAKGRCVAAAVACHDGICEAPPTEDEQVGSVLAPEAGTGADAPGSSVVDASNDSPVASDASNDSPVAGDALSGSCQPFSTTCDLGCTLAPPDASQGTDCIAMCAATGKRYEFSAACGPTEVCVRRGDSICTPAPN